MTFATAEHPKTTAPAPILLDAKGAAALIGVGESTFWKLHAQGRVPLPIRLSSKIVRWRQAELEAWTMAGCPPRDKWDASGLCRKN